MNKYEFPIKKLMKTYYLIRFVALFFFINKSCATFSSTD